MLLKPVSTLSTRAHLMRRACTHTLTPMPKYIPWHFPALLFATIAHGMTIHVAVAGDDRNSGTQTLPFATLARARDEIRRHPDVRPITVIVHGGIYRQTATLALDARDSGSHWQAAPLEEVRVNGGLRIDAKMLRPVRA